MTHTTTRKFTDSTAAESTPYRGDKVKAYGWAPVPDCKPTFRWINKNNLRVDHCYQRNEISYHKIARITRNFEWASCGAILVAERAPGEFYAFDGQHRLLAAKRRSDITEMPCLVYDLCGTQDEANAFLDVNTERKAIGGTARHNARLTANDSTARLIQDCIDESGLNVANTAVKSRQIKCLTVCYQMAGINADLFRDALMLSAELSASSDSPVRETVLLGLFHVGQRIPLGLQNRKFRKRVLDLGMEELCTAISRAKAFYARGGSRVYAAGIVERVNKGLQQKFQLSDAD
jgi:hypothetical protein